MSRKDGTALEEALEGTLRKETHSVGKLVIPYLATNVDPASVDIPFRGKFLCTYLLMTVWFVIMLAECVVAEFKYASMKENPMVGPGVLDLIDAGALVDEKLLGENQIWRLFWTTQMHAGWIHLVINISTFWKLGEIVEPEWGFFKTLTIFAVSCTTGSLLSTLMNGNSVAVGASGGIFGVIAAFNVYILEYWDTIPTRRWILPISLVTLAVSVGCSFVPFVDSMAHIGGALGGMLSSLTLIRTLPHIERKKKLADQVQDIVPNENLVFNHVKTDQNRPKLPLVKMTPHILIADVPSIARPALLVAANPSAHRVTLRAVHHTRNPLSWCPPIEKYNVTSILLWCIRILSFTSLITVNGLFAYYKFRDVDTIRRLRTCDDGIYDGGCVSNIGISNIISNIDISNIDISNIDIPNIDIPNIDIPNIDIPNIDIPNIDISNIDIPNIDIPNSILSNDHGCFLSRE